MPFQPPLSQTGSPSSSVRNLNRRRSLSLRQSGWGPGVLLLDSQSGLASSSEDLATPGHESPLRMPGTRPPSIRTQGSRRSYSIRQSSWGPNILLLDVNNPPSSSDDDIPRAGAHPVQQGAYSRSPSQTHPPLPPPPNLSTASSSSAFSHGTGRSFATADEDPSRGGAGMESESDSHLDRTGMGRPLSTPSISLREKRSSEFGRGNRLSATPATAAAPFRPAGGAGRLLAPLGLTLCFLCGAGAIVLAAIRLGSHPVVIKSSAGLVVSLGLNFIVLICTETVGWLHNISLKQAKAREGTLRYNSNARLFTRVKSNPVLQLHGVLFNTWLGFLLVISYSAAGSAVIPFYNEIFHLDTPVVVFSRPSWYVLGGALLLQALCGLIIWLRLPARQFQIGASGSPIDAMAAMRANGMIAYRMNRCMMSVADGELPAGRARRPSSRQPSIWRSGRKGLRRAVWSAWQLPISSAIWIAVLLVITRSHKDNGRSSAFADWSLFPNAVDDGPPALGTARWGQLDIPAPWIVLYAIMTLLQIKYTLLLHACDLVVSASRDERIWRKAASARGIRPMGPLGVAFTGLPSFLMLIAKPVLHWFYALSLPIWDQGNKLQMTMLPVQIVNLTAVCFLVAILVTCIAVSKPKGFQPAAYGDLQVLSDLVDEPVTPMHFGDKSEFVVGGIGHAGTSNQPLKPIVQGRDYQGSGTKRSFD